MRICVVTIGTNRFGGMFRHTLDLVRGLVVEGHEVEVISPDQEFEDDLDGARWRGVGTHRDWTAESWLEASREEFVRMQQESPVDVVHSEGSSALGLLRASADRLAPMVVMFHGNYLGLVKAAARRARARPTTVGRELKHTIGLSRDHFANGNATIFRRCEAIVPSHQQLADTCRSHRLDPGRVHVVPNGVDVSVWRPRPQEAREQPLFVASGRLSRQKGFDVAISALARLPGRLAIAGAGNEEADLRRLAGDLGIAGRVDFLGPLPPEELSALVAQADVYLFPTRREEAAPLVLPEAMACGVPVIASRIGGIPEVVDRPGENGILIAPNSVDQLAAAIEGLLADPALRRAMGEAARRRVLEEYTLEAMVARTVAVYELAVARRKGPAAVAAAA
jgi:glycosyltransferase involved in cell wall biosynthesis